MSTLTIGEVIDALKKAEPEFPVYFDFCRLVPSTVDSWRGIYAEAALGVAPAGASATVAQLLHELHSAIDGREFTGWKGGEYRYTRGTPLNVDNPGNCTYTLLDRVEVGDWCVILHTKHDSD